MSENAPIAAIHPPASLRVTATAWVVCLLLTGIAFAVVAGHLLPTGLALATAALVALIQVGVQLACFLHVGSGPGGRHRMGGVIWMIAVVAILLGGTLWIMHNLDTRTMQQQMQYMNQQTGI